MAGVMSVWTTPALNFPLGPVLSAVSVLPVLPVPQLNSTPEHKARSKLKKNLLIVVIFGSVYLLIFSYDWFNITRASSTIFSPDPGARRLFIAS